MSIRVLIATEHALLRDGVVSLLRRDSRIEIAAETGDGSEVLPLCRRAHVDIVLLDLRLGRLSGLAVIRMLSSMPKHPRVLMLTPLADAASVRLALQYGVSGFMATTVTATELIEGIVHVAQGEQVIVGVEGMLMERTNLAPREAAVLSHVAHGLTNKEIGLRLGISERTVSTHVTNICAKFSAPNRVAAVEMARRQGLLTTDQPLPALAVPSRAIGRRRSG